VLTSSTIFKKKQLIISQHKDVSGISDTTYSGLMGKSERKRQLGSSRNRWEKILKYILQK